MFEGILRVPVWAKASAKEFQAGLLVLAALGSGLRVLQPLDEASCTRAAIDWLREGRMHPGLQNNFYGAYQGEHRDEPKIQPERNPSPGCFCSGNSGIDARQRPSSTRGRASPSNGSPNPLQKAVCQPNEDSKLALTFLGAVPHSPAIQTSNAPHSQGSMPLSVSAALTTLSEAGAARETGGRLQERLADAQSFLGQELVWLEAELTKAVLGGPEPAAQAALHLIGRGGKRVRPLALLLSAACFGKIPSVARELGVVAELVHSATLLHDDVVDEGQERRGAPAARRIWGNGISVLAGDLLLVSALERTSQIAPDSMVDLVGTLRCLVEGEVVQLRGRTELDVSEATYDIILRKKTASLFAWATRTGARLGGANEAVQARFGQFGELLGIAFQLVDDVLDYSGENTGKTLFADLTEGKLTLPLVLAVSRRPELLAPLSEIHSGDARRVAEVSRAVVESGACDEVRLRAKHHTEQAVAQLLGIPSSPAKTLLELVAFQLAQRVA